MSSTGRTAPNRSLILMLLASGVLVLGMLIGLIEAQTSDQADEPTGTEEATATESATAPDESVTAVPSDEAPPTETAVLPPAPLVIALWQMPDMQPGIPGIQYGTEVDPGRHDDDVLKAGIQIAPMPDDQPEPRKIEHWFSVTTPGGDGSIVSVEAALHAPDGMPPVAMQFERYGCAEFAASREVDGMLAAALSSEQIGLVEADLLVACAAGTLEVLRAVSELPATTLAGEYRVTALAVDRYGNIAEGASAFEVLPLPPPPEPTAEPTPEPTVDPTAIDVTPTTAPTPEPDPSPTATTTPGETPEPEPTPTPVLSPSPTSTPQPTAEPTVTASPTVVEPTIEPATATLVPTATPEPPAEPMPSPTEVPAEEPAPKPTSTPVPTATATETPAATPLPTSTPEPTPEMTEPASTLNPRVLAVWQLPDMQPGAPGIQYSAGGDATQHDDDPLTTGVQIAPVFDDYPEPRKVEYWLVAELDAGALSAASARISVYRPAGSPWADLDMEPADCGQMASLLDIAVATGQITPDAAGQIPGCAEDSLVVFRVTGTLPVTAPAGRYDVVGSVLVGGTVADNGTSSFESMPILGLDASSDQISFGQVSSEGWYEAMSGYTVRNTGNVPGFINLQFAPMTGQTTEGIISEFGAVSDSEQLIPIFDNQPVCFALHLAPGEQRDLTMFIRTGSVPSDEYAGSFTISLRMSCEP